MLMIKLIPYFFYLAVNWNPLLAWHIVKNEWKGERKYGIRTTGADDLGHLEKEGIDITHSTIYMPADYSLLEMLFSRISHENHKHLLDIGCGKGRTLCVAAHFGFIKMTGVDFSGKLCIKAIENMRQTMKKQPGARCVIHNKDAASFSIPDDTDCIFLFNPFDETIMQNIVENITASLSHASRKLTVIYLNPLHKNIFQAAGFRETFNMKKMEYLEASILENSAV